MISRRWLSLGLVGLVSLSGCFANLSDQQASTLNSDQIVAGESSSQRADAPGTGAGNTIDPPQGLLANCKSSSMQNVLIYWGQTTPLALSLGDFTGDGLIDSADLGAALSCGSVDPCDVNRNGERHFGSDLSALLAYWGTDAETADLNDDGTVDGADLGIFLSACVQ